MDLPEDQLNDVFKRFKNLADKKKDGVQDEDLLALVSDEMQSTSIWELLDLQVVCGTMGLPTATVKLRGPDGIARVASGIGTGPVDAAYKAIDSLMQVQVQLVDYGMNSVTEGIEALAMTRVVVRPAGKMGGQGFVTSAQVGLEGAGACGARHNHRRRLCCGARQGVA